MATTDKYDRQLRLWGASGQKALSETVVVLIRATAAGTETLKNLVLPGLGAFVVMDDEAAVVTPHDVCGNFFVSINDTMISRAQATCKSLQELNPDVQGSFLNVPSLMDAVANVDSWSNLIAPKLAVAAAFAKQVLVVASDLEPHLKLAVANTCASLGYNCIFVQSYGLMGTVRLQTSPALLPIWNPKPRDTLPDLRLHKPFASLEDLANSIPWETLDTKDHKHVPYPLILIKVQQLYKQQHPAMPKTYAEKQQFVQLIKAQSKDYIEELNFQEAVQNAYLAYTTTNNSNNAAVAGNVARLLQKIKDSNNDNNNNNNLQQFTILLKALAKFLQAHDNQPPLQGKIPDMTASTNLYIQLQTLYKQQSVDDLEEMKQYIGNEQQQSNNVEISGQDLQTFCANVHHLDLLESRLVRDEIGGIPGNTTEEEDQVMYNDKDKAVLQDLKEAWQEVIEEGEEETANSRLEMLPMLWYFGLQACDLFYNNSSTNQQKRYPGVIVNADDSDYQADVPVLQACLQKVLQRYQMADNVPADMSNKISAELCRYGNAEIHNVAAIVGGVASQEAIKLITAQYVPLYHTYIYNGIASTGGVYCF